MDKQKIGGMKRAVVPGQFEDPEEPKRLRKADGEEDADPVTHSTKSVVERPVFPPLTRTPAPGQLSTATVSQPTCSSGPSRSEPTQATIPNTMTASIVPVPIMGHPMYQVFAAPWQSQQQQEHAFRMSQHMFAMMNPWIRTNVPHDMASSRPYSVPTPKMHQQQQAQQLPLLAPKPSTKSATELETDEEWQIPYNHNFHPRTGFIRDPESPMTATATTAGSNVKKIPIKTVERKLSSLAVQQQSVRNALPRKVNSDLPVELQASEFPLVKRDLEKQFGLRDWEITKTDVLCGRGSVTNAHEGNVFFRALADEYRWQYASNLKFRKALVAQVLVQKIRAKHGRFLKRERNDDHWYEIGDELALAKASQTLREGLAKIYREGIIKAKMNVNTTSSSSPTFNATTVVSEATSVATISQSSE